jgi:hypothetical protein
MKNIHLKFESIKFYLRKVFIYIKQRPLTSIAIGIFLGFIVGLLFYLILQKNVSNIFIILVSAFTGVFAEIFVEFAAEAIQKKQQLKPLQRVFGSIAEDDTWIYVSAWRRDLEDLDHSRLFRNDQKQKEQTFIIGSQFVYGKGDAMALSYLYQAIEKAGLRKKHITLEDSDQMNSAWGRSAICIGAHNSKTREILGKFKNPYFSFSENYSTIIKTDDKPITNSDGIMFYRGVFRSTAHDSSDIDYAVILKLKDEYFPEKNILVIAGLGDTGTAGGAYYLLTHFNELPYEEESFGVLIEVPSGYESARQADFEKIATYFTPSKGL